MFGKLFQCFKKKHVKLEDSFCVTKKVGSDTDSFFCSTCNNTYKQSIGFYTSETNSIHMCVKCHDGLEKFKEAVTKDHYCPYYSSESCELIFEYSESFKYTCDLCGRSKINGFNGRFCCKKHPFNACWDCIHPPFSFIVCPYHPYLKMENATPKTPKPQNPKTPSI